MLIEEKYRIVPVLGQIVPLVNGWGKKAILVCLSPCTWLSDIVVVMFSS